MNLSLLSENDLQIHLVKLVVMHVCRNTATCVSHDYYFQYIFLPITLGKCINAVSNWQWLWSQIREVYGISWKSS